MIHDASELVYNCLLLATLPLQQDLRYLVPSDALGGRWQGASTLPLICT
jgi:hypothetical protein